ncbi:uncharacterized protein TM35_000043500 [Trypanosoma theileri]|uniref:Uncharacterized protein n=1 Tax=Trypanosoma theileri TaxID=67003 RepID=A0A1X0P5B6_9TRYP|nr:uncharacterized protein TM35_000043500 [Trypanosoma theileri]ORC92136.1 hypothetical protein TM35_000043500 [Trypanosoma theileri]
MSGALDGSGTGEEWAEDNGFFQEFAKEASSGISQRKRNRQAHLQDQEQREAALLAAAEEDEVTRKERADVARRQIAAKVLARASPREVQQALKKAKKSTSVSGKETEGKEQRSTAPIQKKKEKKQKRR